MCVPRCAALAVDFYRWRDEWLGKRAMLGWSAERSARARLAFRYTPSSFGLHAFQLFLDQSLPRHRGKVLELIAKESTHHA